MDYQLVQLIVQRLVRNSRVRPDKRDKDRPKFGVGACELNREGGEDELEVPPVLEISGAEEGGAKRTVCERSLRDRLSDGGLPGPCDPIQPVYGGAGKVADPVLDLVQNCYASTLKTPTTISMPILCLLCMWEIVEDSFFGCRRKLLQVIDHCWEHENRSSDLDPVGRCQFEFQDVKEDTHCWLESLIVNPHSL